MTEKKPSPKLELIKGSLWLVIKILTSRKVCYARCPKCQGLIRPLRAKSQRKYPSSCPHCGCEIGTDETVGSHLALKFIGAGFLLCIVGLIVLSALGQEILVCSHLACTTGGYLAGALGLTVRPPA